MKILLLLATVLTLSNANASSNWESPGEGTNPNFGHLLGGERNSGAYEDQDYDDQDYDEEDRSSGPSVSSAAMPAYRLAMQKLRGVAQFSDTYRALGSATIHVVSRGEACTGGADALGDLGGDQIWLCTTALSRGTKYAAMVIAHEGAHNAGHDHGRYIKSIERFFGF